MDEVEEERCADPCPVETVIAVVGGKWKARILLALSMRPSSFGALGKRLPAITQQVLSTRLHALEEDGVVSRTPLGAEPAYGSLYALSEEGRSLMPVLDKVAAWGAARLRRDGIEWFNA